MQHYLRISLLCLCVVIGFDLTKAAGTERDDDSTLCEARCAALEGEPRYRCVKACINARRGRKDQTGRHSRTRYRSCEAQCSGVSGLDGVRCIRQCLDAKDHNQSPRDENSAPISDPCHERCKLLSGSLRDTCLKRCRTLTGR